MILINEMKNKKKILTNLKAAEQARREKEIQTYGKLLSLRPSKVIDSKKVYKRNKRVNIDED